MDSSVPPKDEIWFLRVCHHISNAVCLFEISKQATSRIVQDVGEAFVEKLKDYIQVRQIFMFVVCDKCLELDFNQNLYFPLLKHFY